MEVETSRKLVFTYDGTQYQNIEMKFAKQTKFVESKIPERIFPDGDFDADYTEYIKEVCNTLNREIEKLVDNAKFHIVEVNVIK